MVADDVVVNPLHEAHDSFDPVEISLDSMKGVVQYIKDEFEEELQRGGTYKQPPRGMVGEPEGQMELPYPGRINESTKSELQQIIKEEMGKNLAKIRQATEDDRPLGTGRSLMSAKDARAALKTAELLYKEIGTTKIGAKISAAARAYASDLYAILQKASLVGVPSPKVWEDLLLRQTWKDTKAIIVTPPRKPLDMSGDARSAEHKEGVNTKWWRTTISKMKITKSELQKITKEEVSRVLNEGNDLTPYFYNDDIYAYISFDPSFQLRR